MNELFIKEYLAAVSASSTRARYVLILMILASVVVFSAFWNSREGSWVTSRLDCIAAAEQFKAGKIGRDEYERGKECAENYNLDSVDEAIAMHEELRRTMVDNVLTVHVPILGMRFDVNDLGMLGGFAFAVLLLWFRFALWQEQENLRRVFAHVPKENKKEVYIALAMHQVLTVPPNLDGKPRDEAVWGYLVLGLLFLPFLVEATVFFHDCMTLTLGNAVNPRSALVVLGVSIVFTVLTLVFTINALTIVRGTIGTWRKVSEELRAS